MNAVLSTARAIKKYLMCPGPKEQVAKKGN
jgi:hypothetical protein